MNLRILAARVLLISCLLPSLTVSMSGYTVSCMADCRQEMPGNFLRVSQYESAAGNRLNNLTQRGIMLVS